MNKIKKSLLVLSASLLLCAGYFITLLSIATPAYASGAKELMQKALIGGLSKCYSQGAFKTEITPKEYTSVSSLLNSKGKSKSQLQIYIPNSIGNTSHSGTVTCEEALKGWNVITFVPGALSLFNKSSKPDLTSFGYEVTGTDPNKTGCIWFKYTYTDSTTNKPATGTTNSVCINLDANDKISTNMTSTNKEYLVLGDVAQSGPLKLSINPNDGRSIQLRSDDYFNISISGPATFLDAVDGKSWDDVRDEVIMHTNQNANVYDFEVNGTDYYFQTESGGTNQKYVLDQSKGMSTLLQYLTGSTAEGPWHFDNEDKYSLYMEYFTAIWKRTPPIMTYSNCGADKNAALNASNTGYVIKNGSQWCAINSASGRQDQFNSALNETFNGVKNYNTLGPVKFSEILNVLSSKDSSGINYDALESGGVPIATIDSNNGEINNGALDGEDPTNPGSSGETEGGVIEECYTAAASLGWIICPVVNGISTVVSGVYDVIVQPFLEVKSSLLDPNGGSNSTYDGWKIFRDIANVLFAVAFIVVILAQITGVGISNYNVKKILPRLIVVVILVNVSFIICQLAVDISNLLGSGLNKFFVDMAKNVDTHGNPYKLNEIVSSTVLTLFSGAGAAGLAFGAYLTWEIWLIPFLLALFGCVIGVLFFFIILGARQAGVILLIVLAPVAIVCYALPNTKSIFDKWQKMLTALLLVYPICGVLMGAGQFASALLVGAGGESTEANAVFLFFYMLVAMLLTVLPFFMIPSILKSSMAMMGNLGMKISNFGKGLSGGATRAIRGSEWGRNIQRQNQLDYDTRTANRLGKKIERLEAGKTGEELEKIRNSRRYRSLYRSHATHDAAARRLLSEDARAYSQTGTGPIGRGTESYANMMSAATQEATLAETKNARASYESGTAYVTDKKGNVVTDSTGKRTRIRANDINALGAEYLNRLNELQENPTSRSALTKVRALQDMLMASDAGRTMMKSKQLEHALTYQPDYSTTDQSVDKSKFALAQASEHLLSDQHQGTIKAKNRSTWSMEQDFNKGEFSKLFGDRGITALGDGGSVLPQGSQDAPSGYGIGAYEQGGLDGYDEGSLVGADEGALQSINRTITDINNTAPDKITQSQAKQKAAITALAGSAYGKESLSTQPKVAEQLRKMIINGNTASTIQSTDVKALNRLATDIGQDTLTGEDRNHLVELAREAFKVDGGVRDAEHAAALNSILAAAKQPTIEWSGRLDTQRQADSGPVPIRTAGSQNSTTNPIITASGSASIDELRRQANQNRPNNGRSDQSGN